MLQPDVCKVEACRRIPRVESGGFSYVYVCMAPSSNILFTQVPEHWVCGMVGEKCGVGGHDFMSNRDLLDVKVNLPRTGHLHLT